MTCSRGTGPGEAAAAASPAASGRRARRPRTRPTISGPRTSRGSSATRDGDLLLSAHDRGPAHPLSADLPRPALDARRRGADRSSSAPSGPTACPAPSGPTTACPSPPAASTGSPSSTSGGCGSAFSISAFTPAGRSRTAPTSACTRRSSAGPSGRPRADAAAQQRAFNRFRTEYNEERPHDSLGGQTPGLALSAPPRALSDAPAAPGVPRALPRQEDHHRRDLPLPAPAALPRPQPDQSPHRAGGNRRRHLVHLLQHRPARQAGRAGLHHSWLTPKVLPMLPDNSVTLGGRRLRLQASTRGRAPLTVRLKEKMHKYDAEER